MFSPVFFKLGDPQLSYYVSSVAGSKMRFEDLDGKKKGGAAEKEKLGPPPP